MLGAHVDHDAFAGVFGGILSCGSDDFVPILAADNDHPIRRSRRCCHQL
jgi:hypothetical protein